MLNSTDKVDTLAGSYEIKVEELSVGRFVMSYTKSGTLVIRLADESQEWTMMAAVEAQRILDFLQAYIDSFKKTK